jgi:hypothetical protein
MKALSFTLGSVLAACGSHPVSPSSTQQMTHIAIQESLNGKNVEWMEKVVDDQYNASRG